MRAGRATSANEHTSGAIALTSRIAPFRAEEERLLRTARGGFCGDDRDSG
jgi:hypothetical protein